MDWDFSVAHHIEVWEPKEAHNLGNQMSEKGMHTRPCYNNDQAKIGFESNQGVYLDLIQRQAIFNVFNLSIMLYNRKKPITSDKMDNR